MNEVLRNKILRMRGKKSYGLIAEELGISRNSVAGVMFRAAHPGVRQTNQGRRSNYGNYAPKHRKMGAPVGNQYAKNAKMARATAEASA